MGFRGRGSGRGDRGGDRGRGRGGRGGRRGGPGPICFAFRDGKCTRGDACRFAHVGADGTQGGRGGRGGRGGPGRRQNGTVAEAPVGFQHLVIIPIYWKQNLGEREQVTDVCLAMKAYLASARLMVWVDMRSTLTPGQKFVYWEKEGIHLRVEVGMKDVERQCCTVAKSVKPEDYSSVEKRECPLVGRKLLAVLKAVGGQPLDFVNIPPPDPEDPEDDNLLSKMQERIRISKLKDTLLPAKTSAADDAAAAEEQNARGSAAAVLAANVVPARKKKAKQESELAKEDASSGESDYDDDSSDDHNEDGSNDIGSDDSEDDSDDDADEDSSDDSDEAAGGSNSKVTTATTQVQGGSKAAADAGSDSDTDDDSSASSDSEAEEPAASTARPQVPPAATSTAASATKRGKVAAPARLPSGDLLDDSDEYASESDSEGDGAESAEEVAVPAMHKKKKKQSQEPPSKKRAPAAEAAKDGGGGKKQKKSAKVVRF